MYKQWRYLLPLLFTMACAMDEDPIVMNQTPPPTAAIDTSITYLALGDSYTIGTGVEKVDRWPVRLADELCDKERIGVNQLDIIARSGWRTDNLSNALSPSPSGAYDMVSLLIGVNDQYQGFGVTGYTQRFEGLVQQSIAYAGGDTSRVFVVSIPDYAYTPFGGGSASVSQRSAQFNKAASTVTVRYGIPFYDITPISQRGLDQPQLVTDDNLHPSAAQYRLWVSEVLLSQVSAQLRRTH